MRQVDRYEYRVTWSEEDEVFVARVTEFPSLAAHGDDEARALREIKTVVCFVLKDIASEGGAIPEPLGSREYSGRFNVRLPRDLHRELVHEAQRQGVSLNQLVVARLAR